jgi:hypothetical protein
LLPRSDKSIAEVTKNLDQILASMQALDKDVVEAFDKAFPRQKQLDSERSAEQSTLEQLGNAMENPQRREAVVDAMQGLHEGQISIEELEKTVGLGGKTPIS